MFIYLSIVRDSLMKATGILVVLHRGGGDKFVLCVWGENGKIFSCQSIL